MAAKKQKKQSEQKKQEKPVETREQLTVEKDPCPGCELDCSTCQVNGAKTLRRAACKTLKQESALITKKLATKAKEGDANSTKLLLLLTESQQAQEGAKKKRRGRSAAQELAEESEWSEEVVETLAETELGSREQEG